MRTRNLRKFKDRLAEVNDQLCYHFFASEQARPTIDPHVAASPEGFVSNTFPTNSFGPRIDIRNKFLPKFQKAATKTLGGLVLISAVEYILAYIDEIQSLRAELTPTSADALTHDKVEEQISLKLASWGFAPHTAPTRSLTYLRLRRNHIAHVNHEPHPSLKAVTKNYGGLLSNYWAQHPTTLPGLSFTSQDFSVSTEQEAFSLLNLCRVTMEKYDTLFCSTLSQPHLETFALHYFASTNMSVRGRSLADRYRKFSSYFRSNYGTQLAMTANEFELAWVNA